MRKDMGVMPAVFPMPVMMIATYNSDSTVNAMMMAWGGMCGFKYVALNISPMHKTAENIRRRNAFTLGVVDVQHLKQADYLGMVSGIDVPEKFDHSGLTAVKSAYVDAPIIDEMPVTMECHVVSINQEPGIGYRIVGEIMNVTAHGHCLNEFDRIDIEKLDAVTYDTFQHGYYAIGRKVGDAWKSGEELE